MKFTIIKKDDKFCVENDRNVCYAESESLEGLEQQFKKKISGPVADDIWRNMLNDFNKATPAANYTEPDDDKEDE